MNVNGFSCMIVDKSLLKAVFLSFSDPFLRAHFIYLVFSLLQVLLCAPFQEPFE